MKGTDLELVRQLEDGHAQVSARDVLRVRLEHEHDGRDRELPPPRAPHGIDERDPRVWIEQVEEA